VDEKAARGDKKAIEISQTITADRYEREREIERKERLSQRIRERKAEQKAKKEETLHLEAIQ